jgi:carbon storage regulator
MLVLTRHCSEQIVIGSDVVITVVAVEGSKVRIGVEAPRSVRVDRAEIHERRLAENGTAAPGQHAAEAVRPNHVSA